MTTVWRETLVVGKFGKLSVKLPLAKQNVAKLLYGAHPMLLSSGVAWPVYTLHTYGYDIQ